jgi:HAD superfamily hydrolase (TIGR01509 family)
VKAASHPRASIGAVIFDMDGVLIDSEPAWEQARKSLFLESNLPYPPETTQAIMGMNSVEWSRYLHEHGVPLREPKIVEEVLARVAASLREDLRLMPRAVHVVRTLARRWPLGIGSSADRTIIELALELAGLRDAYAVVVSSADVPRGKPAPDTYLRAAELLGVPPKRCAVVEDSANGIRSGRAAGMRVIAIPNQHFPPAPEALALAAVTLRSLEQLTPEVVAG